MNRDMRQIAIACFYGTIASSAGIALTATSGWLIVRASEQPIMLTLLTAIVAVRAFGMARPFFRYLERLASHNAALSDLANRRTDAYRSLIPLTPARLGRSARSDVLAGVVDDLTEVAEAPRGLGSPPFLARYLPSGRPCWLRSSYRRPVYSCSDMSQRWLR
ncbi:hypothetical protein [Ornithinimicrobium sp. INDO-MA30-4]|uniref:hypothetical protein n=1 Tax=Ornithinimicrobium sp. INDO-MA30-4 TaxID=2908651 RepID=UPI001F47B855|nr:hypothetical protein [Ornithinimicrobium sp. INDO-MA30-4]UJH69958.1 hypothetical protein L0A91_12100 [Ornithinimicrobium sp. INDO-MA30-4]